MSSCLWVSVKEEYFVCLEVVEEAVCPEPVKVFWPYISFNLARVARSAKPVVSRLWDFWYLIRDSLVMGPK